MHELSIALSMIDEVLEQAKKHGGVQVTAVHVRVGAFSGVHKDALEFSYAAASEDSPLRGSRLVIEEVPIVVYCWQCHAERTLQSFQQLHCPKCNTPVHDIRQGQELEITALEVA